MKLATIFSSYNNIGRLQEQSPDESQDTQSNPNLLRSNIDQFWMNPEDLKHDLYIFLERVQNKDPQLARYMRNQIRNVLTKFTYQAKPNIQK
jgi:hypothetical protein